MIPVIDIFAGPGGLGEGFSSVMHRNRQFFDVKLSIEKDPVAHKTLTFRSFYRQFKKQGKPLPPEYYEVLREPDLERRNAKREALLDKYPEGDLARNEAVLLELGPDTRKRADLLIREALGESRKGNWLLIGGPPCQAYSLVGRSRVGGISETDHRVYLYKEYLRIIAEHRPAVFVMENVKGLLSASVNNKKIFPLILKDLSNPSAVFKNTVCPGYKIYSLVKQTVLSHSDYLIRAEKYGIPQKRHRVILLGVRDDIQVTPSVLTPHPEEITLESIIGMLPPVRSEINRTFVRSISMDGKKKRVYENVEDSNSIWKDLVEKIRQETFTWNGFTVKDSKGKISVPEFGKGAEFIPYTGTISKGHPLYTWFHDPELRGVINHESRSHLVQDLKRYFFSSLYTHKFKKFPRLVHFAQHAAELLPDHENAESGKFSDRFRVQLQNIPATTVTSHISKDGHYFIHYDPAQCRSFTVREAARVQTFPDNYLFCGSRTQQFHQVGNAVPPYLAYQIGKIVMEVFLKTKL